MRVRVVCALAAAMIAAGCGGSDAESHEQHQNSSTSPASSVSSPAAAPAGLVIDVKVSAGKVDPTNAQFDAKRGEPIQLRVTSDVADELHVHSVPDHTFAVEAKPDQVFTFTVDVPGKVDVELHDLDRVVATIQVRQ